MSKSESQKCQRVASQDLLKAVKQGDITSVKRALREGARIEAFTPQNQRTAVLEAAHRGYFEIARLLVDRGADLDAVDHRGRTVLDLAGPGKIRDYVLQKKGNELSFGDFRRYY